MINYLCNHVDGFGQVIAVDSEFEIFGRAWCLAELVEARKQGMEQTVKVHSRRKVAEQQHMLSLCGGQVL